MIKVIGKEQQKKTLEMFAREVGIDSEEVAKLEVDRNIVNYFKMFADNLERTLIEEMKYCPITHAEYLKHLKDLMIKLSNSLIISSFEQYRMSGADSNYKKQLSDLLYLRMKAELFYTAILENQITHRYKAELHLKFISTLNQLNLVHT